jgi:Big-like domain-containing protein
MIAVFPWRCLAYFHLCGACRRGRAAFALVLLLAAGVLAFAQNTTISGTVYDPRTTSSALPLPHVLVYATTAAVAPLPAGVQCLTYQVPAGVVSYTYSAVDGTFTLTGIPENSSYTIVIQAGKWRRQFLNQAVGSTPLTGLTLHMPANHTQGDIPLIAVATGNLDGSECVLRDMGISDSEYTDDNGTSGGRIHLYFGTDNGYVDTNYGYPGGGGAVINASTPLETALTENATTLAQYDVVMFPCHGYASVRGTDELNNVLNYANAGGRIFTSDFGYQWLDPGAPYNSPFPPVANWNVGEMPYYISGLVTVNQSFSDGATMAQWLEDAGATIPGTTNQVPIENGLVRLDTVIAPTQPWLTLDSNTFSGQNGNPVMQFTFNAPVGAPAANQCGRVMFNDYHVIPASAYRLIFPAECPLNSGAMSAQEQMLEYALFDLSAFVQPVVVPELNIVFNPSPMRVGSGDTDDQLDVTVTNNSATNAIDSSATLSFVLPPLLTVTAITDSSGGWTCTVATLTCTRNAELAVGASDSVTLDINVTAFTTAPSTGQLTATVSDATFSSNPSASDTVIYQNLPVITWPVPKAIAYGTPLSGTQLDATANVAGSFVYSPSAGTILSVGQHTLTATFTPTDTADYSTATATVTLTVFPGAVTVTLTSSANPIFLSNPVTLTASLPSFASSETGSMIFYSGSTALGTATISGGAATLTTTSIPGGSQSITAVYSGDANVGPATSNAINEAVQDFTLTVSGPSGVNVPGGGTATYTLIVTPVGGATLPAAVSLSASGIPLDATATFSPATVAANSAATSVTLTLKMPGSAALERPHGLFGNSGAPVVLGLVLLPFAGRWRKLRRGWRVLALLAVSAMILSAGVSGCSSLRPQSFSMNVIAVSGSLSHATTLQITVQ